ncbi:MAG: GlxA family transcriptional regulator [Geothrix sp.]|nr:GlxA family transcriptional regulator [Geothrix sp.]
MPTLTAPLTVAILAYPGAQAAAVHGLFDLLSTANRLAAGMGETSRSLDVLVLSTEADRSPLSEVRLSALILPPSLGPDQPTLQEARLKAWITTRHAEGTLVCSVCAGAFLLADTGLLDGRPATTHWGLKEAFAARFPSVLLDTDRLVIDDGDILTAGGLMAWVDLGLKLIHRFLGTATLLATARHFLVDPGGREQRFYTTFAPSLAHGDKAILRVQHWLQKQGGSTVTVPEMADRAHLSERTFLRRFQKATGLTPTDYLQHLRVGKARDLLEQSDRNLDDIAWEVGYRDTGAFRKVFVRIMGLTPGEYRRRFGVNA